MNLKIQQNLCAMAALGLLTFSTLDATAVEPADLLQEHNVLVLYYCDLEGQGQCAGGTMDIDYDGDGNIDETISQLNESFEIAQYYQSKRPGVILKNLADFGFHYTHSTNNAPTQSEVPLSAPYANRWYITPEAYEAWVRAPLAQFIADHNALETDPNDPTDDILAIVTTRGVPAAVSVDFAPSCPFVHNAFKVKTSVEGALARMNTGMVGQDADGNDIEFKEDQSDDGTFGCSDAEGNPKTVLNPFHRSDGPFRVEMSQGCITSGQMFLVTRLDSDFDDSDNDGTPEVDDPTPVSDPGGDRLTRGDVKIALRTAEVKALIDRSTNVDPISLQPRPLFVNKYGTTIVVDELCRSVQVGGALGRGLEDTYYYLNWMRDRGWCVYFNGWDDRRGTSDGDAFLHGPDDTGSFSCTLDPLNDNGQVGAWSSSREGVYSDAPVLVHIGYGRNHANEDAFGSLQEHGVGEACVDSSERPGTFPHLERNPHPGGFTRTNESWSGYSLRTPETMWRDPGAPLDVVPVCETWPGPGENVHGQALNWIAAGGGCAMARVVGGSAKTSLEFFVTNFYENGLTFAEAAYTELPFLGSAVVPIGDPLMRIVAVNPDIYPMDNGNGGRGDGIVDSNDEAEFSELESSHDLNGDGITDDDDKQFILDVLALFPGGRSSNASLNGTYGGLNGLPPLVQGVWVPDSPDYSFGCDLRGDANIDGYVGASFQEVAGDLQVVVNAAVCGRSQDVNGDGVLDRLDIDSVMCNWGTIAADVFPNGYAADDGSVTFDDITAINSAIANGCSVGCPEDIGRVETLFGVAFCPDGQVDEVEVNIYNQFAGLSESSIRPPDLTLGGKDRMLIVSTGFYNDDQIDCDEDGVFDQCQIANDPSLDEANGNLIIDSCSFVLPCPADIRPQGAPNDIVNIDDLIAVVNAVSTQDLEGDITPDNGDGTFGNGVVNFDDLLALIAAFGPCPVGTDAEINPPPVAGLLAVQPMDFSQGYIDEDGNIQGDATAVGNAWATFSQTWDVYRVWVEVPSSSTEIDSISGSEDDDHSLVIANKSGSYYNNSFGNDKAPNDASFATEPELAFDTFVTLGHATSGGGSTDIEGSLNLTANTAKEDLIWFKTGGVLPVQGGSTGWRVLVGQFTVPKGKTLSGAMRVMGDGLDDYVVFSSASP